MKEEVKLNRTDDRPVAFMGELLINESTNEPKDRKKTRWYRIQIYIVDRIDPVSRDIIPDGGYMIGIAHITCWRGERDQYWAEETIRTKDGAANAARVVEVLNSHVPVAPMESDPPEKIEEKKESITEYLELVEWIGQELKTDGEPEKNEDPADKPGRDKKNMFST